MPVDPQQLEKAVTDWIQSEFKFRLGPHAYQTAEQDALVNAEDRLRRVLTGKGDLQEAFMRLERKSK